MTFLNGLKNCQIISKSSPFQPQALIGQRGYFPIFILPQKTFQKNSIFVVSRDSNLRQSSMTNWILIQLFGKKSRSSVQAPKIRPFKWNKMMMDTYKGVIINRLLLKLEIGSLFFLIFFFFWVHNFHQNDQFVLSLKSLFLSSFNNQIGEIEL